MTAINVTAFIDSRKASGLQVRVAVLCAMVLVFDGLDTQVVGYLGPALAQDWQLPRPALGPIFSAGLVGLMLGLMIVGPLADRMGRKWAIVLSTLLFGFLTLLTAAARGITDLLFYRFIAGIGLGGALPNALALTGEYWPRRRRATAVIIMFCGFSLGSILGGGLAAALVAQFGWRSVFVVGGLLPLLLAPVLMVKLPESLQFLVIQGADSQRIAGLLAHIDPGLSCPQGACFTSTESATSGVPIAHVFRDGRGLGTMLLWTVFFLNLLAFFFLQSWLPTVLTDSGLEMETAALVTTLISAGGVVAGLLSGPSMDRFGPYPVLVTLYACGAVMVTLVGSTLPSPSLPVLIATTFGAGFSVSGAQKSVNALAVLFYPTAVRSTGVSWALGVGRVGSILGPLVGGWLMESGWSTANIFKLAALPMLCAAGVVFAMGVHYGSRVEGDPL